MIDMLLPWHRFFRYGHEVWGLICLFLALTIVFLPVAWGLAWVLWPKNKYLFIKK